MKNNKAPNNIDYNKKVVISEILTLFNVEEQIVKISVIKLS